MIISSASSKGQKAKNVKEWWGRKKGTVLLAIQLLWIDTHIGSYLHWSVNLNLSLVSLKAASLCTGSHEPRVALAAVREEKDCSFLAAHTLLSIDRITSAITLSQSVHTTLSRQIVFLSCPLSSLFLCSLFLKFHSFLSPSLLLLYRWTNEPKRWMHFTQNTINSLRQQEQLKLNTKRQQEELSERVTPTGHWQLPKVCISFSVIVLVQNVVQHLSLSHPRLFHWKLALYWLTLTASFNCLKGITHTDKHEATHVGLVSTRTNNAPILWALRLAFGVRTLIGSLLANWQMPPLFSSRPFKAQRRYFSLTQLHWPLSPSLARRHEKGRTHLSSFSVS